MIKKRFFVSDIPFAILQANIKNKSSFDCLGRYFNTLKQATDYLINDKDFELISNNNIIYRIETLGRKIIKLEI